MEETIQAHQKALCTKLWAMANALRGNMEAYEFKNYILGMIFYYYLSDRTEKFMEKNLKNDGLSYEEAWGKDEYRNADRHCRHSCITPEADECCHCRSHDQNSEILNKSRRKEQFIRTDRRNGCDQHSRCNCGQQKQHDQQ